MADDIVLAPPADPTTWLLEQKQLLIDAQIELDGALAGETDPDIKQKRRQVLFECEGALNRIKRILLADSAGEIVLNPPGADLIAKTEQLADQLDQQLLTERQFSAKLKLFADISRMLTRMVGVPA